MTKSGKKMKTWKKIVIGLLIVLLLVTSAFAWAFFSKTSKMKKVDINEADTNLSIVDIDGYVNILLLGMDSRDMDDSYKDARSDVMMVLSLNDKTNEIKLISIYRDTFVKMGKTNSYNKINAAYTFGGPEMAIASVNQALDLNIKKYVSINFKVVRDLVDAVDGITVELTTDAELSELNKYADETAEVLGVQAPEHITTFGEHTLNGIQAVSYGRIRKGVGDDFKRAERTREVITKVVEKAKSASIGRLNKIADVILPQIETNLGNSDILALLARMPKYKITDSIGFPLNVQGVSVDGASTVFPVDLEADVVELHRLAFGQKDYAVTEACRAISNHLKSVAANTKGLEVIETPQPQQIEEKNDDNWQAKQNTTQPVEPVAPSGDGDGNNNNNGMDQSGASGGNTDGSGNQSGTDPSGENAETNPGNEAGDGGGVEVPPGVVPQG